MSGPGRAFDKCPGRVGRLGSPGSRVAGRWSRPGSRRDRSPRSVTKVCTDVGERKGSLEGTGGGVGLPAGHWDHAAGAVPVRGTRGPSAQRRVSGSSQPARAMEIPVHSGFHTAPHSPTRAVCRGVRPPPGQRRRRPRRRVECDRFCDVFGWTLQCCGPRLCSKSLSALRTR